MLGRHIGDFVLPELGPDLGRYASGQLRSRGVRGFNLQTIVLDAIGENRQTLCCYLFSGNADLAAIHIDGHPWFAKLSIDDGR